VFHDKKEEGIGHTAASWYCIFLYS